MKKLSIGLFLLISAFPIFAGQTETGGATFSVLELSFGARGAAMGGAFCGLADDITSIWWNPAGLSQISRSEAQFCHQEWFQGFRDEYGGVGIPIYYGVIGGSFLYSSVTGIEGYGQDNILKGNIQTFESALTLSYATKIMPRLHLGLSVGVFYQNLDPGISGLVGDKGKAIASNLGVLWKTQLIGIGASLQNIGTNVKYSHHSSEPLPRNLKIGLSLLPTDNLVGVFDINVPQFSKINYNLGGEYWLSPEFLALRAGYSYGTLPRDHFSIIDAISAGFGIKLGDIELDYSYAGYGELGMTHRINLNWVFGAPEVIKTGEIIVSVIDAETYKPLQAIVITETSLFEDTVLTSPTDGKVKLSEIPIGEVHITVQKDFYTPRTDTIWLEWFETAKLDFPIQYTGPKGVPAEKLVEEGLFGRILDGEDNPLSEAIIIYKGPSSGTVETDADGWYKIPAIPPGSYTLEVESKKHDYFPETVSNVTVEPHKATLVHCTLKKVKTLRLFFETDRAYVHPRDFETLNTLADFMTKYKENNFDIHGHTDPRQPKKFKNNEQLSQARAQSVADYLVKKGIASTRLTVKGWGDQKPIAPNDTEENMALNRRIEIIIKPPH